MKIISGKRWEEMNQTLIDLQMDLNDMKGNNAILIEQRDYLKNELENEKTASNGFSKVIEEYYIKIEKQRMLIRNLKALLTKNGIDYSKLVKKVK